MGLKADATNIQKGMNDLEQTVGIRSFDYWYIHMFVTQVTEISSLNQDPLP